MPEDLLLDFSASGSLQVQLDQGDLCQQGWFLGHLCGAVD